MEGYIKYILHGWIGAYMHMCIAWMGVGTGHPSVNDASAFLGRAQSCRIRAWPGDGTEKERRREGLWEDDQRRWRW
jgi:hypothetical protein